MKRIGIDVGGTNADAALLCGSTVLATAKAPSTANTLTGVVHSLERLQSKAEDGMC
jgi:N-methylhydantoinase A/oxoprolinase/acetone carboxylase beta subunit